MGQERMGVVLLLTLVLLAGCATSRELRRADGWMTHVVSCGGSLLSMDHCLEKAGEVCAGRGYEILAREGDDASADRAVPGGGLPVLPRTAEEAGSYPERRLHIRCR